MKKNTVPCVGRDVEHSKLFNSYTKKENTLNWIVIVILIIVILAIIKAISSQKQDIVEPEFPYKKLDVLFSPAERSFLGVLNQAVGKSAQIFGKVRVADVITPKKGMLRSDWQKAFNKISGKHFDFLLCNKEDLSVLCVIELNDSSHNSRQRKKRDLFLEGACQKAELPLIQITAKATYNINEIRESLEVFLSHDKIQGLASESKEPEYKTTEFTKKENEKFCPKCSSKLVKRVAKKGRNSGNEFWACCAFPKCRYSENV